MLFGQASVKSTFAHGPHTGRTVEEVAQGLRAGTISADTLPIDYVVRNGQAIALNNRSQLALTPGGMQPTVTRNLRGTQQRRHSSTVICKVAFRVLSSAFVAVRQEHL